MNTNLLTNASMKRQAKRTPAEIAAAKEAYRKGVEERKAARLAKKAARELAAVEKVPHQSKILSRKRSLPDLDNRLLSMFDAAASSTPAEIALLAAHLRVEYDRQQALASLEEHSFQVGDTVQVVSALDPRDLGRVGTIEKVARTRVHLDFGDGDKGYFFTADCSPNIIGD